MADLPQTEKTKKFRRNDCHARAARTGDILISKLPVDDYIRPLGMGRLGRDDRHPISLQQY